MGEYSKSLDVLNEILSDKEAESRYVEYITARMLSLILHYELGNFDLLEYSIPATLRYVREKKKLSKFERLFFKLIGNLIKVKPGEKVERLFDEFKYELEKLDEREYRTGIFDRVDIMEWVEPKL